MDDAAPPSARDAAAPIVAAKQIASPAIVALDTEVFVRANFSFQSGALQRLAEFVADGSVKIVLPSVTVREVERRIAFAVEKACERLRQARNEAKILRSCATQLTLPSEEALKQELLSAFRAYQVTIEVTTLNHDNLLFEPLLKRYFEFSPPFEKGKKQKEFLDAAALEVIRHHGDVNSQRVILVSGDQGVRDACSESATIQPMESLDQLFKSIALVENSPESIAAAETLIERHLYWINELVEEEFPKHGFQLEDEIGEVEELSIREIEGRGLTIHTIRGPSVSFEMDLTIHFTAKVTYDTPDDGTFLENLDREVRAKAYGYVLRDKSDPSTLERCDIELHLDSDGIRVYEDMNPPD